MLTVQVIDPPIEFTIPESWEEVTLKQYLALHDRLRYDGDGEGYYLIKDALECFVSDVSALHQLGAYEEAKMKQQLKYLANRPDFRKLTPPDIIAGVKPPKEIGACTTKQKWTIESIIEDLTEEEKPVDFISLSIPLLSVYLYPMLTGKPFTDQEQIDEVRPTIEALPVTQALPLSAFFLIQLLSLASFGQDSSQSPSPNPQPNGWLMRARRNWKRFRNMPWFGASRKTAASPITKPTS